MNIDLEQLKSDPDYWDECDPTGGEATHYIVPVSEYHGPGFFIEDEDRYVRINSGGMYRKKVLDGSDLIIPRPDKQWSGPEDGLPPVGLECEYFSNPKHGRTRTTEEWETGDILEVLAHRDKQDLCVAVVFNKTRQSASTLIRQCIRPIKSEKERVVEAAMECCEFSRDLEDALSGLYDLGALKMPEEE